jgi:broad specificity phosphatase PhoE
MEIILIRHGKPEFELIGKARARELPNIVQNYNESGIAGLPPPAAAQMALRCDAVICSDLRRSLHSAEVLGIKNVNVIDALFREVAIPHFTNGAIELPVSAWGVILRTLSIFGFSRNGESLSMARTRAKEAAAQLVKIAHNHERIMLVGHGFINYFIAKELLSNNWIGPSRPGQDYWEYGVYQYKYNSG